MSVIQVNVKHAGKSHAVALDTAQPAAVFKQVVHAATGVPPDRMKVMIKGGVLKDDTDWARVAPKAGQTFMVVGSAGELPKPPSQPVVFLEDLGEQDLAEALRLPVGFKNLGNTCYMNATLQAMRAIPELQTALSAYTGPSAAGGPDGRLVTALRDTYRDMDAKADGYVPGTFLNVLRQLVPQFTERSQHGHGFAQQDAEECWTQIVNHLNVLPGTGDSGTRFVEQYMMGEMVKEMRCIEAPEEEASITKEQFKTVPCNITGATNYMQQGIADSMEQAIEKRSPTLGREAQYTLKARISRLPANLVVHMVRFAWKRDINKKAKIMRKVKFPFELDAAEWCTDELKGKMRAVADKMKEVDRDRRERAKVRRKTKSALTGGAEPSDASTSATPATDGDVPMADAPVLGGALEDESVLRERERTALDALVHADLRADTGASVSGLYELAGIVTHKGAGADSGHYIGFVRAPPQSEDETEDDERWYKFDDEKVSVVKRDKIVALEGGGEDSVAYVLLYRSKKF